MKYWGFIDWIAAIFLSIMGLFILALLFVMLPATLSAEAACFEKGYPKAEVTWNLKRYCINLQGTVTVDVAKLP